MSDFQVNIQKSVISRQKREISELETQLAESNADLKTAMDQCESMAKQLAELRDANKDASEHLNQLLFVLIENECEMDDWIIERTGTDIVQEIKAIKVKLQVTESETSDE